MNELIFNLIPWNGLFTASSSGFNVAVPDKSDSFISNSDLAQIDLNLAEGIHFLLRNKSSITGSKIRTLLRLWDSDAFVPNLNNGLVGISDIVDIYPSDAYVSVDCDCIPFVETIHPITKQMFRIPSGDSYTDTLIPRKWLDQSYPGWDTRLANAQSLDLSMPFTFKSMLEVPVRHHIDSLPGDLFI